MNGIQFRDCYFLGRESIGVRPGVYLLIGLSFLP